MAEFEPCFEKVIKLEGGYTLHTVKGDKGGTTYAGIARNFWPAWGGWKKIDSNQFDSELKHMVKSFYKENFWDVFRGDDILFQNVAFVIYDFAVNAGISLSIKIVQKIVGASVDGVFGPETFGKLNLYVENEVKEREFVANFSLLKVFRYKDICLHDKRRKNDKIESNLKFLCGWINRIQKGLEYEQRVV